MKLVAASIREVPGSIEPWAVDFTFETLLISRHDWKALAEALKAKDIPRQTHVETRFYASRELAESAIAAFGAKREAA